MTESTSKDEKRQVPIHAIEKQEAHVQSAEDLVNRQREIISKFSKEGLETFAEMNLLYELENSLETHKMRLGRLLSDAGLGRAGGAKSKA